MRKQMNRAKLGPHTTLISSGSTPRGGESVYLKNGPVMLIRSQNVRMNHLDIDDVAFISEEINNDMGRSVVKRGDVLLNITGASIGRVAIFDLANIRANVNQHVCIIRSKPNELDPYYLMHFLSSPEVQHDINHRHQHGGTRQALTFGQITEFEIPLLPLSEQRRIADILDQANSLRRRRGEAIRLADDLVPSIFYEMFGSRLDTIEHRPLATFVEEFRYGTSTQLTEMGRPTLRIPNVVHEQLEMSDMKMAVVSDDEFDRLRCRDGDVFFVRTNGNPEFIGRSAPFDSERIRASGYDPQEVLYASYLIRARVDRARLCPTFLQAYLRSPVGRRAVRTRARTSAGNYNINTEALGTIPVPEVPPKQQHAFADRVLVANGVQSQLKESQRQLDDLFHSLVQRAFRGEL
jgi:type I restriction enzyme, S subunit